jgi:hypothetical protein
MLQVACVQHFRQQPLSCLTVAAVTGKRSSLAAAVAGLSRQQLVSCCQSLLARLTAATQQAAASSAPAASAGGELGRPSRHSSSARSCQVSGQASAAAAGDVELVKMGATAAIAAAVVKLQAVTEHRVGSSPSAAAVAAARAVLEDAVAAAMQAYGRWRLGVLLLHTVATFTGRCCSLSQRAAGPVAAVMRKHLYPAVVPSSCPSQQRAWRWSLPVRGCGQSTAGKRRSWDRPVLHHVLLHE